MSANERRPAGTASGTLAESQTSIRAAHHRWHARPDLLESYPDARCNLRTTMFGLPLEDYRKEYRRRQAESWQPWELATRFPHPDAVAS